MEGQWRGATVVAVVVVGVGVMQIHQRCEGPEEKLMGRAVVVVVVV